MPILNCYKYILISILFVKSILSFYLVSLSIDYLTFFSTKIGIDGANKCFRCNLCDVNYFLSIHNLKNELILLKINIK